MRLPGGYSEGCGLRQSNPSSPPHPTETPPLPLGSVDFADVETFYRPRAVGERVVAQGRWPEACTEWSSAKRKEQVERCRRVGFEVPCSLVEITVAGFEPTSPLCF